MSSFRAVSRVCLGGITVILLFFGAAEYLLRVAYWLRNSAVDYVPLPYGAIGDLGPIPPWVDGLRMLESDRPLIWKGRANLHRKYIDLFSPAYREEQRTAMVRQFIPKIPKSLEQNPVWEISLNSEGFREREFPAGKPSTVFRIVCLGDSWTFGTNVGHKESYPQTLGSLLKQEFPGRDIEVLNLGVLGYSSFQGLELLRKRWPNLTPDAVLIGFAMNDGNVAGFRDKDMPGLKEQVTWGKRLSRLLEKSASYKLLEYAALLVKYRPKPLGYGIKALADVAGGPNEAWVHGRGAEVADYEKLEQWTRVSPKDYEANIVEMIHFARKGGASVILLYNQLWKTPYQAILHRVSKAEAVPLVDGKALIDEARGTIERELERRLNRVPVEGDGPPGAGAADAVFRVYSGKYPVPDSMYIVGAHPSLGNLVPNSVRMYDDGAHGDQRAGDKVWSYQASIPPGKEIFYVYTNSGRKGEWEGLDIPEIRSFTPEASRAGRSVYRPIETFGESYMHADGWHTNAAGYELIAKAVVGFLKQDPKFRAHVSR